MLTDLLLFVSVIVLSGLIFLPLHVIVVRANHGANVLLMVNISVGVSAIAAAVAGWLWFGGVFSSEGAKAVACVGGAISFLGFGAVYNLLGPTSVDRSISAHILNLIYQAPNHQMSKESLFAYYTHSDVLEKRFEECARVGMIERHGSLLALTASGRRLGFFYTLMGKVLSIPLWHLERYRASQSTS